MAQSQRLTCCEQLARLQRVAELVGVLVLDVPPPKFENQPTAYVKRSDIRRLEDALIAAGYDMAAVRARYRDIKKRA